MLAESDSGNHELTSEANADQREEKAAWRPPSVSEGGADGSGRMARPKASVQSLRQLCTNRLQKTSVPRGSFFILCESCFLSFLRFLSHLVFFPCHRAEPFPQSWSKFTYEEYDGLLYAALQGEKSKSFCAEISPESKPA